MIQDHEKRRTDGPLFSWSKQALPQGARHPADSEFRFLKREVAGLGARAFRNRQRDRRCAKGL